MFTESLRHFYLRRITAPLLRIAGPRLVSALARRLARGVFDMNTTGRQFAEARLRDAQSDSEHDCRAVSPIVVGMYEHLGRFLVEVLFARRLMRPDRWRQLVTIEGESLLRSLAAEQRGCLLASSYLGNPAMGAFALGQIFRPVHAVIDLDAFPAMRGWESYLRNVPGVKLIARHDAATEIPQILRRGGAVWMIAEHHRPRGRAFETTFLGRPLRAYPTIDHLAKWLNCPVAIVTCLRSPRRFQFTLTCHDILERVAAATEGSLTRSVLSTLERGIMSHPEQYLWSVPSAPPHPSDTHRPNTRSVKVSGITCYQSQKTLGPRTGIALAAAAPTPDL